MVETHRGLEIGTLLEDAFPTASGNGVSASETATAAEPRVLRVASEEDERTAVRLRTDCEGRFDAWCRRIGDWKLQLELIDLEWTLDKTKLILYVLNDRGPESTRLALQAAAAGLETIEVQPIGPDGPIAKEPSGGCGSGHCGTNGSSGGCCN